MKILRFGKLRDALGEACDIAWVEGETVSTLRGRLAALHPHAAGDLLSARVRACVGDMIVTDDYPLAANECVEFLPPLSGG